MRVMCDHGYTHLDDEVLGQQWGNTKVYMGRELRSGLHCSAENCQERAVQSFLCTLHALT